MFWYFNLTIAVNNLLSRTVHESDTLCICRLVVDNGGSKTHFCMTSQPRAFKLG